jgi:hypothetical protein
MPFCHKCGAQNEPEAAYCEECGSRLVTAGQPVSPGTPASVEPPAPPGAPPAPIPLADAGIPAPPEPSPPAGLPMPQRGPCRRRCALVLVAALVAGIIGVGIFIAVSSRGGGDEGEGTSVKRETPEATAAPSPTIKATPKRSPTPKTTVSPKSTPTRAPIATPTEEVEPPAVSQGAQVKAIAVWVEGYGEQYAGDCATTNVETDAGKYCSSLQEDRGDSAIYLIGLSFSEFDTWLLLERVDSDWVVSDWAGVVDGEMVPPW